MTTLQEAAKLAIEALTYCEALNSSMIEQKRAALNALRAALAQQGERKNCPQPEICGSKECEFCRDTAAPQAQQPVAFFPPLPRSKGFIMPYNPGSVGTAIYRICQLIGIEDLHWHDLRREGVGRLFEAGLDIPRVAMVSGHQSWAPLRRYTHLKPGDVVARMTELEKLGEPT